MTESIQGKLQADLVVALKAKDAVTLSTLRMLKAALLEAKTAKPKDATLSADEEIEILQRYVKKRRETITEMEKLARADLVAKEQAEIEVTMRYLPQPLSEAEVRAFVVEAIAATGATTPKEMGKVISAVMPKVKGKAEGSLVSRLVKELLV